MLRCFGGLVVRGERGWKRVRGEKVSAFFVQVLGLRLHRVMRQIMGAEL